MIQAAMDLHRQGRLPEAERLYRSVLAQQPDQFEALHYLGVLKLQQGRPGEAFALISKAVERRPEAADALSNLAAALLALERFHEAVVVCDRILARHPADLEALFNRAAALLQIGRAAEALAGFDRVLAIRPDHVNALFARGNVLALLERYEAALSAFERLLALRPDFMPAAYNRGNALLKLQRFEQALAAFERVLAAVPDNVEALNGRAVALKELERHDEALAACGRALSVSPAHAGVLLTRANVLLALGRPGEALEALDLAAGREPGNLDVLSSRAFALAALDRQDDALQQCDRLLALRPDHANALNCRGNALHALGREAEAMESYDRALAADPDHVDALCNRGGLRSRFNRWQEAVSDFARAAALQPDNPMARFGLCMAQLPVLYDSEDEIADRRTAYEKALAELCEHVARDPNAGRFARAVGADQPFYLAYQGFNDRDLQSRYGSLICRIMSHAYPSAALRDPAPAGERVRVGIVSGFFRRHANWNVPIKGWLGQLDRRRFQVFGYWTGVLEDTETIAAADLCDRFRRAPMSMDAWRQTILADAPDVLIYPEVGMDAVTLQLAAQRLAPVQCTSWGHPDSSGLPTMDYFLSSDLMEPGEGDDHYTEKLVRLPNLSIYYEPVEVQEVPLARPDLGLRPTATVFWCGQSLFKYLPQYDEAFTRIARQAGDCQFAFIQHPHGAVTDFFRKRLELAFASQGLNPAEHCIFWSRLDQKMFSAAVGQCDIILDSIGWSGCNTTLESLPHGLPVVTLPGKLMRGRHTMAILKMMGVTETIAATVDDYVATAVRLGKDLPWRKAIAAKMAANRDRVYRDRSCIEALQDFLEDVGRQRPSPT